MQRLSPKTNKAIDKDFSWDTKKAPKESPSRARTGAAGAKKYREKREPIPRMRLLRPACVFIGGTMAMFFLLFPSCFFHTPPPHRRAAAGRKRQTAEGGKPKSFSKKKSQQCAVGGVRDGALCRLDKDIWRDTSVDKRHGPYPTRQRPQSKEKDTSTGTFLGKHFLLSSSLATWRPCGSSFAVVFFSRLFGVAVVNRSDIGRSMRLVVHQTRRGKDKKKRWRAPNEKRQTRQRAPFLWPPRQKGTTAIGKADALRTLRGKEDARPTSRHIGHDRKETDRHKGATVFKKPQRKKKNRAHLSTKEIEKGANFSLEKKREEGRKKRHGIDRRH
nr:hypothetical protein [Pandoravirus massiliensis]